MLDADPSAIRRMINKGHLEAHQMGKRGVRVYLDSVEGWQKGHPVQASNAVRSTALPVPVVVSGTTKAAHRNAMAHLQSLGLVHASRQ
jgi:excisionase family DNA binding protein